MDLIHADCRFNRVAGRIYHLYERPKRYYRVRWRSPYTFTMVGVSETPYPDCTVEDPRGETYSNLLAADLR